MRYLNNRRENLAYDQAIAKDLPLGSGMIESASKHITQARMKIPGASLTLQAAENFVSSKAISGNHTDRCKLKPLEITPSLSAVAVVFTVELKTARQTKVSYGEGDRATEIHEGSLSLCIVALEKRIH